jgi:hypothetical protein
MTMSPPSERAPFNVGDRAFALDALCVTLVSVAIAALADRLAIMSVLVPLLMVARTVAFTRLERAERGGLSVAAELLLLAACTLIGGFNDWNSVHHHRIYDYGVPVYFPAFSMIPLWMLLFWGMVLRFFVTLAFWVGLSDGRVSDDVYFGPRRVRHGALKVGLQLLLVFATRQAIYRLYLDPILSWLPFALAIVVYALLFRPDAGRRRLFLLALTVGPVVEVVYIQLGGLHRYHLGVLGGVPLWIALWWPLSVLVWADLAGRALSRAATPPALGPPGLVGAAELPAQPYGQVAVGDHADVGTLSH